MKRFEWDESELQSTVTNAIGYTRLSQDSDLSIDRQKRFIEKYCADQGLKLETILDDGERSSGFNVDREEYQRLRARVETGDVDAVVVNDRARIGRDFDERMRFVLDLRHWGVELHTALDGQVDLSEPSKVVFETFHAAKDDEGKREEIKKSRQAVRERLENGCYHGTPPQGLEFAADGCHLVKSVEWEDLERAFEFFEDDEDITLSEISRETGFGISTLSRMRSRGMEYYEGLLKEYGESEAINQM